MYDRIVIQSRSPLFGHYSNTGFRAESDADRLSGRAPACAKLGGSAALSVALETREKILAKCPCEMDSFCRMFRVDLNGVAEPEIFPYLNTACFL